MDYDAIMAQGLTLFQQETGGQCHEGALWKCYAPASPAALIPVMLDVCSNTLRMKSFHEA
jgi:hypothetical protein